MSDNKIKAFQCWKVTIIGALIAYTLGYLPSTLIDIKNSGGQITHAEPAKWLTILFAALIGIVTGAVLSFMQWFELHKYFKKANIWIPANMLAWSIGMIVIFSAMDIIFIIYSFWLQLLFGGLTLFVTGLLVGTIQGKFVKIILEY